MWTRQRVQDEVVEILGKHVQEGAVLSAESHLVADLGIDSLGVMEVIADLEDRFGLHIPDSALGEVGTLGDVVGAVTKRLAEEGKLES
jgi:acyl carrier protein